MPEVTINLDIDAQDVDFDFPNTGGSAQQAIAYTHVQEVPSMLWVIQHDLGFNPNVRIMSVDGVEIIGTINDNNGSTSSLSVSFSEPYAGRAVLT